MKKKSNSNPSSVEYGLRIEIDALQDYRDGIIASLHIAQAALDAANSRLIDYLVEESEDE